MPKLTKTTVESAPLREKQYSLWCSDLPGFGVYILPSGQRTYFVDYRNVAGARRRLTIGRHGKITAEAARKQAIVMMGQVAQGDDPAEARTNSKKAVSVRELCEIYLAAADRGLILGKGGRPKRESTIYTDRGRILRHIVPLLGSRRLTDVNQSDIHRFIRDVAGGKTATIERTASLRGKSIVKGGMGTAARTTGLLGSLLSFAVSEGLIAANPANGVKRPAGQRRVRRLSIDEYSRLGAAISVLGNAGETQGSTAIYLLALTGCRSGEILQLKWDEVDVKHQCLRLANSKEGASIRPIGRAALDIIADIDRKSDSPHILAPVRKGAHFGGLPGTWKRAVAQANMSGVTPHTLRHSFASVAADMGFTESTIAAMLGHQSGSVTSRYIHSLDSVLLAAADQVAAEILRHMSSRPASAEPTTPF